ncbi:MAG: YbgA family protein [Vicinamibacterales bacterium]
MTTPGAKPRIGISRCLLGDEVRFDGGHKRDPFLVLTFGRHVEWVPVCPEVEAGMGTPREAIHLVTVSKPGEPADAVRLVGNRTGADWTRPMRQWARVRLEELAAHDLVGFVVKKDSPSCGMERVRLTHLDAGGREPQVSRAGRGLFTGLLLEAFPNLPVEEEGRLNDPRLRDNFVERVFAYQRLRGLFGGRWTLGQLVRFHTVHKLQMLAHSRARYTELGRLVARAKSLPRREIAERYEELFMSGLARMATPGRQADVMQHMLGHFSEQLTSDARQEVLSLIEDHRTGLVPLVVPLTLIRHHVRRLGVGYLADQVYLDPHPRELSLRNHV